MVPVDNRKRPGGILILTAICLIVLLGFAALAVDLGVMVLAREHCQNAADAAALAAARTLATDPQNIAKATSNAVLVASKNYVLGTLIDPGNVTVDYGTYTYNLGTDKFVTTIPDTDDLPNLARVQITATVPAYFSRVLGFKNFTIEANATASHRPRDITVILDFSGSMHFDSLLGLPFSGNRTMSNNPESVFPLFGHYSAVGTAALQNPNPFTSLGGEVYGSGNITVATASGNAIVKDFYQNAQGSSGIVAWTAAADAYATTPGGDNFPFKAGSTVDYAQTVTDIGDPNFETNGYGVNFKGFTQGPRYWGNTFFMWPPDPRPAYDWRQKFFGVADNTKLWDGSGNWRAPSATTYKINYDAILTWIHQNCVQAAPGDGKPFPPQLRAGRILYYDAIPTTIDTAQFPPTDMNQRFWKEYIDEVLGVNQTGNTTYQVVTPQTGYGDDFTWGKVQIKAKPGTGYMDPLDNPKRPKLHFWFGPMTMVDFLGNSNRGRYWWPGTCSESPLWELKIGVRAALNDIKNNHPNDYVALSFFSHPENAKGSPANGRFNSVRVPLGRDYDRMMDALWYPLATLDNPKLEIRPYDAVNMEEVPRANGATCPAMGLMHAYNQFSSSPSLRSYASPVGTAGGNGRVGASKLVILETDGMANTPAQASFTNAGAYQSFYNIRPGEYPKNSGTIDTQIYGIINNLAAKSTASPPGYSTSRKNLLVHCLAFGTTFEPGNSSSEKTSALNLLQNIQFRGNTQASVSTPLADYKMIVGSAQQRIERLQKAFQEIMQDGIQVTLIE